jgi:hypothetical protein
MVTEIEHARALNARGWAFMGKTLTPVFLVTAGLVLYLKHCELHVKARSNFFYNRSKLFGGAKNPQY